MEWTTWAKAWRPERHLGGCTGILTRLKCKGHTGHMRNEVLSVPFPPWSLLDPWLEPTQCSGADLPVGSTDRGKSILTLSPFT